MKIKFKNLIHMSSDLTPEQDEIFKSTEFFNKLVNFTEDKKGGQIAIYKLYLYKDIREYNNKEDKSLLAEAHLLYQKYFGVTPHYDADIPQPIKVKVRQILWADKDGSDKDNIVDRDLFNPVNKWLEPQIIELIHAFEKTMRGKKVLAKINTNHMMNNRGGTLKKKKKNKKTQIDPIFRIKQWSVEDVCTWLRLKNYGKYRKLFEEQEITGDILLELTEEDLEGVDIDLFDRQGILNGIEKLRQFISTLE